MKACSYSFLTLILVSLAFLFSGQALADDIDATLPDSDDTSSFQVKNPGSTNNILMKVQSGGNVGIGTDTPLFKLDVEGNINIGNNGDLVFDMGNPYIRSIFGDMHFHVDTDGNNTGTFTFQDTDIVRMKIDGDKVGIATDSPNSTLHVNGSFSARYSPVSFSGGTSDYNVLDNDFIIGITSAAQTGTIILPSATSANMGRIITIKNETSEGGSTIQLMVAPASGDTINDITPGDPGYLLGWGFVSLYSNGSNHWLVIGGELSGGM